MAAPSLLYRLAACLSSSLDYIRVQGGCRTGDMYVSTSINASFSVQGKEGSLSPIFGLATRMALKGGNKKSDDQDDLASICGWDGGEELC